MTPGEGVRIGCGILLAALACGCNKRPLGEHGSAGLGGAGGGGTGGGANAGSDAGGGRGGGGSGGAFTATNKLDMLFVVEDAPSMLNAQHNLTLNFPTWMTALKTLGGQPDLHIAVVSTDMGVGSGTHLGCNTVGGNNGIFQHAARGTCTATGLEADATYIADGPDGRNYAGRLEDVFACIAPLGESGCRFGQPLAAAARALGADGHAVPDENAGFLRDDAFLFVV